MEKDTDSRVNYGNWVPLKFIYVPFILAVIFLVLSFFTSAVMLIFCVFFLLVFAYFAYAWYMFSASGMDIQSRVRSLVLDRLDWNGEGKAIDIGCGNGALAVDMAKKYGNTRVIGLDYWGAAWDYSKNVCEENAKIAGVAVRTEFQKASASALPFEDEYFDAAVSNMVFHEVKDAKNKRDVIKEALRVVKKGGAFSFQDLFLMKAAYGDINNLLEEIRSWGVERVEFFNTSSSDFIPALLKLPFMLGAAGIIYGKK
jgi:SAM-dependent methyltransferase